MQSMFAWLMLLGSMGSAAGEAPGSWGQFRGPGSRGLAVGDQPLPTEIGPDQYVVWKTPLPPGHSSPVVHGERIYLTAAQKDKLFVIGLERTSGKELWRVHVPSLTQEKIHAIGNHAQATPVTDGTHV